MRQSTEQKETVSKKETVQTGSELNAGKIAPAKLKLMPLPEYIERTKREAAAKIDEHLEEYIAAADEILRDIESGKDKTTSRGHVEAALKIFADEKERRRKEREERERKRAEETRANPWGGLENISGENWNILRNAYTSKRSPVEYTDREKQLKKLIAEYSGAEQYEKLSEMAKGSDQFGKEARSILRKDYGKDVKSRGTKKIK